MSSRMTSYLVTLVCFTTAVIASPAKQYVLSQDSFTKVHQELRKAEIVPTVIDDFVPSIFLNVSWSKATADLGNTIPPKSLQDAPSLSLYDATKSRVALSSNLTYTIALTDPDAPSRDDPKWAEMCHWIATGLVKSSSTNHNLAIFSKDDLDDVVEYKPPGPPKKTGKHRYVFLVFLPANGTTEKLYLSKPSDRQHWGTGKERHGVRDWAKTNGLVPVGANFIYSQHKKQ